jgi:hypothetical protein
MAADGYEFRAELWEQAGPGGWHFLSLPHDLADDIADRFAGRSQGFGSIRVTAAVGETRWSTSIFPDSRRGTYVLPVKQAVRSAEGLVAGTDVDVRLVVAEE